MSDSKDDKFNDTLKRMMAQEPKPQEEMKKGRKKSGDEPDQKRR